MERRERGDLWAWMTLETVRVRVEKRMTSPAWEVEEEAVEEVVLVLVVVVEVVEAEEDEAGAAGVDGDGTGEG